MREKDGWTIISRRQEQISTVYKYQLFLTFPLQLGTFRFESPAGSILKNEQRDHWGIDAVIVRYIHANCPFDYKKLPIHWDLDEPEWQVTKAITSRRCSHWDRYSSRRCQVQGIIYSPVILLQNMTTDRTLFLNSIVQDMTISKHMFEHDYAIMATWRKLILNPIVQDITTEKNWFGCFSF